MGYFESVDTGRATRRIVPGFGSGAAHLRTAVEGYVMTKNGLQRIESGVVDSAGGKAPGVAVPLALAIASGNPIGLAVSSAMKVEGAEKRTAKEIADQLRVSFQREGWI